MQSHFNAGTVIKAKQDTESGADKVLANYQIFDYKFRPMNGCNRRIGSQQLIYQCTH